MAARLLEITDLLWRVDADDVPVPVAKAEALTELRERGQRRAARIVSAIPDVGGILDSGYVDALGFRVHCELQRLGEELQLGRRVAALLGPVVAGMRRRGAGPVRVIDVGCGLGFVIRALAASSALGGEVELVGVDLNPVLVAGARRLADQEGLACRFVQGDALRPGVAIWDIAPCLWSTLGAWVFHQARMREPVSRHDGVLSARRSHTAAMLEAAARAGAPGYEIRVLEGSRWHPRALYVLRPVVGTRA